MADDRNPTTGHDDPAEAEPPAHVALHVHSRWRDLPGALLLKHELESTYGHRVTLVPQTVAGRNWWDWVRAVPVDVVVFPKIIDPPKFFTDEELDRPPPERPLSVVLPTELGRFEDTDVHKKVRIPGIDRFLAWNEGSAEKEAEHHSIPRSRIEVTGQPRFDWFHARYTKHLEPKPQIRKRYGVPSSWEGTVVTVAGSFPRADTYRNSEDREKRRIQGDRFGRLSPEENDLRYEAHHLRRSAFVDLLRRVSEGLDDVWTVYKPHPMSDPSYYRDELSDAEWVSVVKEDYSFNFLQASDLHVHCRCTTGLEAALMGVPRIDFAPTEEARGYDARDAIGSLSLHAVDDVLDAIEERHEGEFSMPEKVQREARERTQRVFHATDGYRTEAAAQAIHEAIRETGAATGGSRDAGWRGTLLRDYGIDTRPLEDESLPNFTRRLWGSAPGVIRNLAQGLTASGPGRLDALGLHHMGTDHEDKQEWERRIREARRKSPSKPAKATPTSPTPESTSATE